MNRPGQVALSLYAPISSGREFSPLSRTLKERTKLALIRLRDRVRWKILRSHHFTYHAWQRTAYTNRGDIAIREAIRQILLEGLGDKIRFSEFDWGTPEETFLSAASDALIICGGGYFSGDASTGVLSNRADDVTMLERLRAPVIAFGIGFNEIWDGPQHDTWQPLVPDSADKVRRLCATSALVSVRDQDLLAICEALTERSIRLIGDPALFLYPAPSCPIPQARDGQELRIGLNFALHGPISSDIFQKHFLDYVRFLKRVQQEYSAQFFYFVHCETENIAVTLLRLHGVRITQVVDCPPDELVTAYGRMDVAICQMLHASVLATNAGIATMNIGYDRKNRSFYELLGVPELCIAHSDAVPERLSETFSMLMQQRADIAKRIEIRKAELLGETRDFVAQVAAILG